MTDYFPAALSASPTTKAILFKIAQYWFAVPIAKVLKVVNLPPELRSLLEEVGFVDLGDREIALLNLEKTANSLSASTPERASFLIVVQLSEQQLCAIPVNVPPSLGEIDLADARQLRSHAATPPLNLVGHIAPMKGEESPGEVFLLDLQKVRRLISEKRDFDEV